MGTAWVLTHSTSASWAGHVMHIQIQMEESMKQLWEEMKKQEKDKAKVNKLENTQGMPEKPETKKGTQRSKPSIQQGNRRADPLQTGIHHQKRTSGRKRQGTPSEENTVAKKPKKGKHNKEDTVEQTAKELGELQEELEAEIQIKEDRRTKMRKIIAKQRE